MAWSVAAVSVTIATTMTPAISQRSRTGSAFELKHVETGVPVADEHQAVLLDEDVGRFGRERDVRPRIDQLLWRRRNPRRDLFRRELIAYVEHTYAGDVVRRKQRVFALERTRPVLVKVVR